MVEYSPEKKRDHRLSEAGLERWHRQRSASRHRISQNEASITTSCVQREAPDITTALRWDVPKNVWGPYEKDPKNPIVTSVPGESLTSARIQTI